MGRGKKDTGRDGGPFLALPLCVLNSKAYLGLSMHARALLLEVGMQFHSDDNGRMLLSRAHLATRGWLSADMIQKAKNELLAAELIFETVKGQRPNKASWYAITWRKLDPHPGYDAGARAAFKQGAYQAAEPIVRPKKNAPLVPRHGTETLSIAPSHGTETPSSVPPHGAIRPVLDPLSVPPHGHPLEKPSVVAVRGAVGVGAGAGPAEEPLEKGAPEKSAPKKKSEFGLLEQLHRRMAASLASTEGGIPPSVSEGSVVGKNVPSTAHRLKTQSVTSTAKET